MNEYASTFLGFLFAGFLVAMPAIIIIALRQGNPLMPKPKARNFGEMLAEWASLKGLLYTPQRVPVLSGVYNNRWFSIHTTNEENALEIHMTVKNPRRQRLQIFGDWLEESGVINFTNRFRIYSTPSGLGETLFETGTHLREALLRFPGLRSRMELHSDPKHPNQVRYALLTDLPATETLETIMDSLHKFCDALEQAE